MKKQIISLILLAGILVSCGTGTAESTQQTTDTAETETETVQETDYLQTLEKKDYNGAEYHTLGAEYHAQPGISHFFSEEITGDLVRDSLYNRDSFIEEEYNCDLVYTQMERYEAASTLQGALLSGEKLYHVYGNSIMAGSMTAIAADNGFYNMHDMGTVDLTKPWWSSMIADAMTLNGKLFYATGDIVPNSLINAFCIYVNLQLLTDYGYSESELYETVYNGEWTWDVLYEYAGELSQDLNQDNQLHTNDDFFGFVSQDNTITTNAMLVGAGVDLSRIGEDGHLEVNLNNESVLQVVENIQKVKKIVKYDNQETVQQVVFPESRALFCHHLVSTSINTYRDLEVDYSILPMPKASADQDGYRSLISTWSEVYVAVPMCCPDTEMTGHLMEVMAYMGYRDTRDLMYEVTLKDKIMRNEDSVKMLDLVFSSLYLDFNVIYNFGGSGDVLNKVILGVQEFASSLQAVEDMIRNDVQKVEDVYFAAQ